jgi:hypothetical protein
MRRWQIYFWSLTAARPETTVSEYATLANKLIKKKSIYNKNV